MNPLVEWPFYPFNKHTYSLIRPVCQQEKLYRVDFLNLTGVTICHGVRWSIVRQTYNRIFKFNNFELSLISPILGKSF